MVTRASAAPLVGAALGWLLAPGPAAAAAPSQDPAYARVSADAVVLGNGVAERRWDRRSFRTTALVDKRDRDRVWSTGRRDFTLTVGGAELGSELFDAGSANATSLPGGGRRVTMELQAAGAPAGLTVTRIADAYPGIAGFRTQTIIRSAAPVALSAATLDEAATGAAAPTLHAFRAGADWRQPGYRGPDVSVGDPHAGTWRDSRTAARGAALEGPAQWLSVGDRGRSMFMVMERNDFPSSRGAYGGGVASLRLDYTRDVVILGPLEEQAHVENPGSGAGRERMVRPGIPLALEPTFTGFGRHDGDEPWQFHRYLVERRLVPYPKAVTFNSNGTDSNRISTGAKDDMDLETVRQSAAVARRLGVETFILDDGWQARSGDWQPDSPEYPEPRWDGSAASKFAPRFPDPDFRAAREAIAPMRLGLWMSPLHFHPSSEAYRRHPEWICRPVGDGLLLFNTLDPDSSSNEAGIVTWGPPVIPHVESRIREGIENWSVAYWKFDFMAWLDCAGQADALEFHDAFVAMIDRLQADYPSVTFQIDETNDYRLFPFESVSRGPSWFQNGTPPPERLLHNLWNLSPFIPAFSLGQHALGGKAWEQHPVATLMAAALPSHITFFSDIRQFPAPVVEAARPWLRFYRRNRRLLTQLLYPLLKDPLEKDWTALQSWNPDAGEGALLAFRQESSKRTKVIPLRNVPPGRRFDLFSGPTDRFAGSATSAQLTRGIRVTLSRPRRARVLLIRPARARPSPPAGTRPRPGRRPARGGPRFTG